MKAKIFIPIIFLGLLAVELSMYGMMLGGSLLWGMIGFIIGMIGLGFAILKFVEINYPVKRPPLTYE